LRIYENIKKVSSQKMGDRIKMYKKIENGKT
jgi:hypothetical protein